MAFPIRFLIDECVSPTLVSEARAHGHQAWHVNHRGLARQRDPKIFKKCLDDDLVLVTNNARDFLSLYRSVELHAGLIILLPSAGGSKQRQLFGVALDWIDGEPDLVNKLIVIADDGGLTVQDFPA